MTKASSLTLAAVLVASSAAFFVGRATAPSDESSDTASAPSVRVGRSDRSARDSAAGPRETSRLDSRSSERSGTARMESPGEEMQRIIGGVDPLERTQAWLDFINTLDPEQFESVVAEFRESNHTREHMAEYGMLLTAWAKVDPLAALDYASEHTGTPFARNTILASWAANDPNGAIAWAEQNHQGEGANPWMVGVIRGVASYDPERASELMSGMPFSRERGEALSAVLPQILQRGTDATKAWVASIDDERLRAGIIQRVAEDFAKEDPRGTADWLLAEGGESANRSMDDVITTWAREDQDGAVAYYNTLPAGDARSNALRGLTNQMAMDDPQAAADFLDAHRSDANDRVYQQFVWHSFGKEPALAADYIARIENPREQEGMYRRMLDGWLRRDYDAATAWIGSTPLPENVARHVDERMQQMQQRQQ